MKKAMISTGIGMACGSALTAYFLTNAKAKRKATKMVNAMMDEADQMVKKMNNHM